MQANVSATTEVTTTRPPMETTLTQRDWQAFRALVDSTQSITELIPDDIQPDDLWQKLTMSCGVYTASKENVDKLKPLIGRMLVVMQKYPEMYESLGYRTFDDWMSMGMRDKFGISRSEAYAIKTVALALPDIDPERAAKIGTAKLMITAKALPPGSDSSTREQLLKVAETSTIKEYTERLADSNLGISKEELQTRTLMLVVSVATYRRWDDFRRDADMIACTGADSDDRFLNALMDEAEGEWRAQMGAATAAGRVAPK